MNPRWKSPALGLVSQSGQQVPTGLPEFPTTPCGECSDLFLTSHVRFDGRSKTLFIEACENAQLSVLAELLCQYAEHDIASIRVRGLFDIAAALVLYSVANGISFPKSSPS
jgi:hypothetical protein